MRGLITRTTGSSCMVRTDSGSDVECIVKGNFRIKGIRSTNPVAVGDYVEITEPVQGEPSFIKSIEDRRNYIVRRSSNLSKQSHILACNLDQCVLIVTIQHPETSTVFVDRFLATAQAYRVPAILVFNKVDLLTEEDTVRLKELMDLYSGIGYSCLTCDAKHGTGVDEIVSVLSGKVTLLSGNSGVGKSTLVNRILPDLRLKTGLISDKHDTGMHTTTFSEMFELPGGGWIIDTPGVKGFGNFDMEPEEIGHYFPEIFSMSRDCRFGNCTHTNEPGCAVKNAVSTGEISLSRFTSYLSMLQDEDEDKYRKPQE
ncbi:MAG: ribosome small subunit-dependent GTPase A [Bacteroidaceae bacterium]|nr:ribosome small subunit-dependent GTPase A [Bacteroidaceae bacterium]